MRSVLAGFAILLAGALVAAPSPVAGQQTVGGDSLRVYLLTMGPGAAVWERFGHNAIWIHDPAAGTDIAYHWGLFDMSEAGFLTEFLKGRMVYSMGDASALRLVEAYRRVGRDVTVQELALTVSQAAALQTFVQWNVRPENRRYRYDYFRDNCSTRVRDALDDAVGGVLQRELSAVPSEQTYRSEAFTRTADDVLLTTGMDLGLGPLADQPISRWELAFIPMRLRDDVRRITVNRDGQPLPLVAEEEHLDALVAVGAGLPETSPIRRVLGHLLVGLALGGLLVGASVLGTGTGGSKRLRSGARWLAGALGSVWGLGAGLLGLLLLAIWTLTDHEFGWTNENLLQVNPLALALVVMVPRAIARSGWVRATHWAGFLLGLSLFGLFLNPLPVTPQANLAIIALALPMHVAVFYVLWRFGRPSA
jgi:hypothetical protein